MNVPGPREFGPMGSSLSFSRDPLGFLQKTAAYGDIAQFHVGKIPLFLVNRPEYIHTVLVGRAKDFHKSLAFERMRPLLGNGLLTSEDEFHHRQRRLAAPAFHHERIQRYAEMMIDYAVRTSRRWEEGRTVDMAAEMMRLTLAVAGKSLFNADVEQDAKEIGSALREVLLAMNRMSSPFANLLDRLPLPSNRRTAEGIRTLDRIVYRMIAERRASGEDRGDLLSMLLAARDEEGDGRGMSDKQLRDEVMTIFLAGHETTAVALTWTWYLLSQNPEAEEKLHAELAEVLGGQAPAPQDLPRLTYTRRVFSEALRMFPPAFATGRKALKEVAFGDVILPAGSTVLVSQWVTHHDERWWTEPWKFNPDRWTPELEARRPKFAYFPFGGGTRICIGEQFAWTEGILVLAALAQTWQPRLVEGFRPVPQPMVTLRQKAGMQMVLHQLQPVSLL